MGKSQIIPITQASCKFTPIVCLVRCGPLSLSSSSNSVKKTACFGRIFLQYSTVDHLKIILNCSMT